jgi:hypothetical protein
VKTACHLSKADEGETHYGVWKYLLVWNSADKTRKGKCLLVILVEFVKHQLHKIDEAETN